MVRDIPDVVAPVKTAETSEDAEGDEDEGEQPILGHVSMATDLVRIWRAIWERNNRSLWNVLNLRSHHQCFLLLCGHRP